METELSLPCSQQPVTGPYPEPDATNPHPRTLLRYDPFLYYLFTYAQVFRVTASGLMS
jgi:hypothetical protein